MRSKKRHSLEHIIRCKRIGAYPVNGIIDLGPSSVALFLCDLLSPISVLVFVLLCVYYLFMGMYNLCLVVFMFVLDYLTIMRQPRWKVMAENSANNGRQSGHACTDADGHACRSGVLSTVRMNRYVYMSANIEDKNMAKRKTINYSNGHRRGTEENRQAARQETRNKMKINAMADITIDRRIERRKNRERERST